MNPAQLLLTQAHIDILNLVDYVVDDFAALDIERHSQAPAAMGLLTLWDEFKEQVQNGKSVFFEAYEATMLQFARQRVNELLEGQDPFGITALWIETHHENDEEFMHGDNCPSYENLSSELEYIIYDRVCQRAESEEIKYRPDASNAARKSVGLEKAENDTPQNADGQMTLFD